MSKKFFENLTQDERAELAKAIKPLRQSAGLTKKDVYAEAGISRQTLDNIENGVTVPQVDILMRVLDVVGYETEEPQFSPTTETWLSMIGTLIELIPTQRRANSVDRVIRTLASAARSTDTVDQESDSDSLPYIGPAAVPERVAADTRTRKADEPPAAE